MGVYLGSHGVNLLGGQPQGGGTVNNQDKSVTPTAQVQNLSYSARIATEQRQGMAINITHGGQEKRFCSHMQGRIGTIMVRVFQYIGPMHLRIPNCHQRQTQQSLHGPKHHLSRHILQAKLER